MLRADFPDHVTLCYPSFGANFRTAHSFCKIIEFMQIEFFHQTGKNPLRNVLPEMISSPRKTVLLEIRGPEASAGQMSPNSKRHLEHPHAPARSPPAIAVATEPSSPTINSGGPDLIAAKFQNRDPAVTSTSFSIDPRLLVSVFQATLCRRFERHWAGRKRPAARRAV
jgi:hypothetical protein